MTPLYDPGLERRLQTLLWLYDVLGTGFAYVVLFGAGFLIGYEILGPLIPLPF